MFDSMSRYADQEAYAVPDSRGRTVKVVPAPPAPDQSLQGYHLRKQGQRIDHMAFRYLRDACGFWRICEMNDVMLPESLTEADEIAIPRQGG